MNLHLFTHSLKTKPFPLAANIYQAHITSADELTVILPLAGRNSKHGWATGT